MAKFAGFLKRLKQFTNTAVKGLKAVKDVWNNVVTKPGVSILNTVFPITKPITDALFTVDNYVNKGIDWVIDKTNKNKPSVNIDDNLKPVPTKPIPYINPKPYHYPRPIPYTRPLRMPPHPIPHNPRPLNFNI